jgi:hypothetical protein
VARHRLAEGTLVLGAFLPKVEEAMEGALERVSIQEVARAVLPNYRAPKRRKGVTK